MTKADLIEAVQTATKSHDLSKTAVAAVIDATFDSIGEAVKKEGRFQAPGFGTFTIRDRKAREGRNPQTGETIQIAASKSIGFKVAPKLKATL